MLRALPFLMLVACAPEDTTFDHAMLATGQLPARVENPSGQPIVGAVVGLRVLDPSGEDLWLARAPVTADGSALLRYTLPLTATDPTLVAMHPDYQLHTEAVQVGEGGSYAVDTVVLTPR